MKFDTKAESPKLFFAPVRWLTDEEYPGVVRQGETEEAKRAINMTVAQADGVKAKAAPMSIPGKSPAAAAAPAPSDDEEEAPKAKAKAKPVVEADDGDEPEVRKAAPKGGAAVPEKKSKLSSIVSDWDDE